MIPQRKIGIIVQRYGAQVNGGAEVHARMIAEKLSGKYDVTVLTSRALSNHTWEPVLSEGESIEGGIKIIRFDHPPKPPAKQQHKIDRGYRGRLLYQKIYRSLGKPRWYLKLFPDAATRQGNVTKWLETMGPATYDLLSYLKNNRDEYAAYIFITYIYFTTAAGLRVVADKSLLIPTMHDEPAAYLPFVAETMTLPQRILFNTESEKRFSEKQFNIADIPKDIAAVGVDPVDEFKEASVLKKYNITGKYILYVGRIEPAKGCDELLEYFHTFLNNHHDDISLVLAGKNILDPIEHPNVIYAGFISDEDKLQLMKQCEALVIPSRYESLSLVLLEGFACKVPVMVNGNCEVLRDHLEECKGGWIYNDCESFGNALTEVIADKDNKEKGIAGYDYVMNKYSWPKVMATFDEAIEYVISKNENSIKP